MFPAFFGLNAFPIGRKVPGICIVFYRSPVLYPKIKNRAEYNSYFAHSENYLVSVITDPDSKIRQTAYEQILKARSTNAQDDLVGNVRAFKKPEKLEIEHPDETVNRNKPNVVKNPRKEG